MTFRAQCCLVLLTDKAPTYGIAISELKAEGKCPQKTVHRQAKYLNNVFEADHGKLKQFWIRPVRRGAVHAMAGCLRSR